MIIHKEMKQITREERIADLEEYICNGIRDPKDLDLNILEWYITLKRAEIKAQETLKT